jgi:hypothetical protein
MSRAACYEALMKIACILLLAYKPFPSVGLTSNPSVPSEVTSDRDSVVIMFAEISVVASVVNGAGSVPELYHNSLLINVEFALNT